MGIPNLMVDICFPRKNDCNKKEYTPFSDAAKYIKYHLVCIFAVQYHSFITQSPFNPITVHREKSPFTIKSPLSPTNFTPSKPHEIHERTMTGWWLTYPSEKYKSVGIITFPIMEIHKSHVPVTTNQP